MEITQPYRNSSFNLCQYFKLEAHLSLLRSPVHSYNVCSNLYEGGKEGGMSTEEREIKLNFTMNEISFLFLYGIYLSACTKHSE